jgi:hypothetical protein
MTTSTLPALSFDTEDFVLHLFNAGGSSATIPPLRSVSKAIGEAYQFGLVRFEGDSYHLTEFGTVVARDVAARVY